MVSCPKCRSYRISGPSYQVENNVGERLVYRCNNCGYSQSMRCADAENSEHHTTPSEDKA